MNAPDGWVSEAEALNDIWDDEADCIDDEGQLFGLPPRPSMQDINLETIKIGILSVYEKSKAAKTGAECSCPSCGKSFTKKSYQQAFCSNKGRNNCKDMFWNRMSLSRSERANVFTNRTQ